VITPSGEISMTEVITVEALSINTFIEKSPVEKNPIEENPIEENSVEHIITTESPIDTVVVNEELPVEKNTPESPIVEEWVTEEIDSNVEHEDNINEDTLHTSHDSIILRNPLTGETARIHNNYRGLKRWLKKALVTEGLLEKIYPNKELNAETNAKIRAAVRVMKTLTKYHP
jgi:hypothetical protein